MGGKTAVGTLSVGWRIIKMPETNGAFRMKTARKMAHLLGIDLRQYLVYRRELFQRQEML